MKENLTLHTSVPYSIRGMEQGEGPTRGQNQRPQIRPEPQVPKKRAAGERPHSDFLVSEMFTQDVSEIKNGEIRAFAAEIRKKLDDRPIRDWSLQELKDWYGKLGEVRDLVGDPKSLPAGDIQALQASAQVIFGGLFELPGGQEWLLERAAQEAEKAAKRGEWHEGVGAMAAEPAEGTPLFRGIEESPEGTPLRSYREKFEQSYRNGLLDPMRAYDELNEAVRRNEITRTDAEPYFDAIAARARGQRPRGSEEGFEANVEEIQAELRAAGLPDTRTEAFKLIIRRLNPARPMDDVTLRKIAEDTEASEMFLDKIISKPFDAPEAHYELSFYAAINLDEFLTEMSAVNRELYGEYVRKKEASLRFHEMNRILISESGNVEAFRITSRSVSPRHLNTASRIEGVEIMRQLLEIAHGRLYAKTNRVTEANFQEEILNWATNQFYQLAGYTRTPAGQWEYTGEEVVKSKFSGSDGNPRPLEDWEIRRAVAFGRNIQSSFYRHSELISWSNIPPEWEAWLQSLPTETVVRVLAGIKYLSYRFRISQSGGGSALVRLIYNKLQADYRKELKEQKTDLTHLGKLDILEDLIPVRFMRGGGFDKGWRAFWAYLDNDAMRISLPALDAFDPQVREGVGQFIKDQFGGRQTNLGNFLIKQEYIAQELASEGAKIAGVELKPEERYFDYGKQARLVARVLTPLMGFRPKNLEKIEAKDYKFNINDFDYDPNSGQINLSLGVLISFNAANENVKAMLWRKAADFLPLRLAYFLSEQGVKEIQGYENVRGQEGTHNLFNDKFEAKLIKAQRLRMEAQKLTPGTPVPLDRFLDEVGLTPEERFTQGEKDFIRSLQDFGREKAGELAKISFPHIPFLDDVPFQSADYVPLGAEVFPRRLGSDFAGYYGGNEGLNAIVGNLTQKPEDILGHLRKMVDSLSGPEGLPTAQDIAFPVIQSYFELASQWRWTRWIPLAKTIRNTIGLPTSWLQTFFGRNAPSWDESTMNDTGNKALSLGILRREKLPGEEKSQMIRFLEHAGATWKHVLLDQVRVLGPLILLLMIGEFFRRTTKEATS